jgi:hypothetical protein
MRHRYAMRPVDLQVLIDFSRASEAILFRGR